MEEGAVAVYPEARVALAVALATLLGATLVHWALRRVGRRLPILLARRFGGAPSGPENPWHRPVALGLLVPKLALWLGVLHVVGAQSEFLAGMRDLLIWLVTASLRTPLFTLGEKRYAALDLLVLPALLVGVWVAVSALTRVLRSTVLGLTGIERGAQDSLATLARYVLSFVASIVVLQVWGLDVSSLTMLLSVLGVGIGFGLQNIANNFVSGLLISVERPVRPGDFVHVGEHSGTVQRIGARSTEIRTLDHVTILVPNSRLLESEVVNWSHGDPTSRIHVPVAVACGSDLTRVRAAILEAARSHPDVLPEPRPAVDFQAFGASALELELLVWIRDPRAQNAIRSSLNYKIDASLRRYGIEMPFPQHDLHLRSPRLDRLVDAWSRRHFTDAELASPVGDAPMPPPPPEPEPGSDGLGPRVWSPEALDGLVGRLRGPGGVKIVDRRHLLTVYPRCFLGREAVDWLRCSEGLTRDEALAVGRMLVERGLVHHVLDEHGFEDGNLFYRFRVDEG